MCSSQKELVQGQKLLKSPSSSDLLRCSLSSFCVLPCRDCSRAACPPLERSPNVSAPARRQGPRARVPDVSAHSLQTLCNMRKVTSDIRLLRRFMTQRLCSSTVLLQIPSKLCHAHFNPAAPASTESKDALQLGALLANRSGVERSN